MPIIIGELSNEYSSEWNLSNSPNIINEGYKEVIKLLPNSALVSADGLTLKVDGIHFNSKSLREFGYRYAVEYLKVVKKGKL